MGSCPLIWAIVLVLLSPACLANNFAHRINADFNIDGALEAAGAISSITDDEALVEAVDSGIEAVTDLDESVDALDLDLDSNIEDIASDIEDVDVSADASEIIVDGRSVANVDPRAAVDGVDLEAGSGLDGTVAGQPANIFGLGAKPITITPLEESIQGLEEATRPLVAPFQPLIDTVNRELDPDNIAVEVGAASTLLKNKLVAPAVALGTKLAGPFASFGSVGSPLAAVGSKFTKPLNQLGSKAVKAGVVTAKTIVGLGAKKTAKVVAPAAKVIAPVGQFVNNPQLAASEFGAKVVAPLVKKPVVLAAPLVKKALGTGLKVPKKPIVGSPLNKKPGSFGPPLPGVSPLGLPSIKKPIVAPLASKPGLIGSAGLLGQPGLETPFELPSTRAAVDIDEPDVDVMDVPEVDVVDVDDSLGVTGVDVVDAADLGTSDGLASLNLLKKGKNPFQPITDSLRPVTDAAEDLIDAFQPIVDAANVPITDDPLRDISNDVAFLLAPGAKFAAPFVGLTSQISAPFVEAGAKVAAPVVKVGAKIVKVKGKAILTPIVKTAQNTAKKAVLFGSNAIKALDQSQFNTGFTQGAKFSKAPGGPLKLGFNFNTDNDALLGGLPKNKKVKGPLSLVVDQFNNIVGAVDEFGNQVEVSLLESLGDVVESVDRGQQSYEYEAQGQDLFELTNPDAFDPYHVHGAASSGYEYDAFGHLPERVHYKRSLGNEYSDMYSGPSVGASSSPDLLLHRNRYVPHFNVNQGRPYSEIVTVIEERPATRHRDTFYTGRDRHSTVVTEKSRYSEMRPEEEVSTEEPAEAPMVEEPVIEDESEEPVPEEVDVTEAPIETTTTAASTTTMATPTTVTATEASEEEMPAPRTVDLVDDLEVSAPKCEAELKSLKTSVCHRIEEYSVIKCNWIDSCDANVDIDELIDVCKTPSKEQLCQMSVKAAYQDQSFGPCNVYNFKFTRLLDFSPFCRHQLKCLVDKHFCNQSGN